MSWLRILPTAALVAIVAAPSLVLRAADSAPAGALAHLTIWLERPVPLTGARIVVSLDPALFGPVERVETHGATGDQYGHAQILDGGRRADIRLLSPSGGLGRLPALPLATLHARVLGTAPAGPAPPSAVRVETAELTPLAATTAARPLPQVIADPFSVAGELSVTNVIPNIGRVEPGSVILIEGTGFDPGTTAALDGVVTSAPRVISREWMELSVEAPADITARRLVLTRPDTGETLDQFIPWSSPTPNPATAALPTYLPLFPNIEHTAATTDRLGRSPNLSPFLMARNPGRTPLEVVFDEQLPDGVHSSIASFAVGPGAVAFCGACNISRFLTPRIRSSAPVQLLANGRLAGVPLTPAVPRPLAVDPRTLRVTGSGSASAVWKPGDPPPPPGVIEVSLLNDDVPVPFTVSAFLPPGEAWYQVRADNLVARGPSSPPARLTVVFDPTGLKPGTYFGAITLRPQAPAPPHQVTVSLYVPGAGGGAAMAAAAAGEVPPRGLAGVGQDVPSPWRIVNAASQSGEQGIVPGGIVTLYGSPLAPRPTDTRVLFDGVPGRILYAAAHQMNVVAPRELAGRRFTIVEVEWIQSRLKSARWGVPVLASAPGLFTADASGTGRATAFHADDSAAVDEARPARAGEVIHLFATGLAGGDDAPMPVEARWGAARPRVVDTVETSEGVWRISLVVPANPGGGELAIVSQGRASQPSVRLPATP